MTTMHYVLVIWFAIGMGLTSCTGKESRTASEPEPIEVMLPNGVRISCKKVITDHISTQLFGCQGPWKNIYCKDGVCMEITHEPL